MREYKIKRGHKADLEKLISTYFGAKGDVYEGIKFEVEGIGKINMKQEKNSLFIDIVPPKKILSPAKKMPIKYGKLVNNKIIPISTKTKIFCLVV